MKYEVAENYRASMMLVCLFKVFHDAGITYFEDAYGEVCVNESDFYYEYILDALQYAAPYVERSEGLYHKYGFDPDDDEVNIWAYSCPEMQRYYKTARKLYRMQGCREDQNPYIREIEDKMEDIRGFYSYNFDYSVGKNGRKHSWNFCGVMNSWRTSLCVSGSFG